MGLPWLLALLSLCFFGAAAGQLTSEDQRVDGWLLQKIISLQTDCFIDFFQQRFFHLKGLITRIPPFTIFTGGIFQVKKNSPADSSFFRKNIHQLHSWFGLLVVLGFKSGDTLYIYRCFQKQWYPQIIHFNRVFPYKSSILGYLYFGNTHILKNPFHKLLFL